MIRPVFVMVALVLTAGAVPAQLATRWNDAFREDEAEEAPAVRVWIEGSRVVPRGGALRVFFETDEDAYVVVGRVDAQGRLTVLHPAGRNRVARSRAGQATLIRGFRLGVIGTFAATERVGSTGYVFAVASHAPFDLSRLTSRDYDRYVTGVSLGEPSARYIGDPHRVISRFVSLVSWDENTLFDYDVDYYSVDMPAWGNATYASARCLGGYGYSPWYYGTERLSMYGSAYDDYDSFGGCPGTGLSRWQLSCLNSLMFWAYGASMPCYGQRGTTIASGSRPPIAPPAPGDDSARVNPWAPDSIRRPAVDRSERERLAIERRPAPVGVGNSGDDLSFSIPSRALGRDRRRAGDAPEPGTSGSMPMPGRNPPVTTGESPAGGIEWVRPPRGVERALDERLPVRGGRTRDFGSQRDREPSYAPANRPERSPQRMSGREARGTSSGTMPMPAPRRGMDMSPGQGSGTSQGSPRQAEPRQAAAPPAKAEGSKEPPAGEKKPDRQP